MVSVSQLHPRPGLSDVSRMIVAEVTPCPVATAVMGSTTDVTPGGKVTVIGIAGSKDPSPFTSTIYSSTTSSSIGRSRVNTKAPCSEQFSSELASVPTALASSSRSTPAVKLSASRKIAESYDESPPSAMAMVMVYVSQGTVLMHALNGTVKAS